MLLDARLYEWYIRSIFEMSISDVVFLHLNCT